MIEREADAATTQKRVIFLHREAGQDFVTACIERAQGLGSRCEVFQHLAINLLLLVLERLSSITSSRFTIAPADTAISAELAPRHLNVPLNDAVGYLWFGGKSTGEGAGWIVSAERGMIRGNGRTQVPSLPLDGPLTGDENGIYFFYIQTQRQQNMIEWLDTHIVYWHWVVFGLLLAATEIFVPAFFMLWLGVSAIVVGVILSVVSISFSTQLLIWIILSITCLMVWFKYISPMMNNKSLSGMAMEKLLGNEGTVVDYNNVAYRGQR